MNEAPPVNIMEQMLAHIADKPSNPCINCMWKPGCDQGKCAAFLDYKTKLAEIFQAQK